MEDSSSSSLSSNSPYAGEDLEIFVQFSSSSDYFISLPAEDDINVRPHSRNSLVSLVFLPEGDERVDWTDFPPSKSLLYIITDQAPWSMWNVSL